MATSLEDVAKAARCNKANCYYYFRSKSDILYEIATRTLKELIKLNSPIACSDLPPIKKLEALITNHLDWQMANAGFTGIGDTERRNLPPKLLRAYIDMRDEYENYFRKVIEEGIVKQQFRPTSVKLMSMFILGFLGSVMRWYKPKGELTSSVISSKASDFVLQGLVRQDVKVDSGGAKSDLIKRTREGK